MSCDRCRAWGQAYELCLLKRSQNVQSLMTYNCPHHVWRFSPAVRRTCCGHFPNLTLHALQGWLVPSTEDLAPTKVWQSRPAVHSGFHRSWHTSLKQSLTALITQKCCSTKEEASKMQVRLTGMPPAPLNPSCHPCVHIYSAPSLMLLVLMSAKRKPGTC